MGTDMKKLCVFLFMCMILATAVLGSNMMYDINLTYDSASDCIVSRLYIKKGSAIVGHFGFSYNAEKLTVVQDDFSELPENLAENPVKFDKIVKPVSDCIIVTQEILNLDRLVNKNDGYILFGWYVLRSAGSLNEGDGMVAVNFKLKDGVDISQITEGDIVPVTKEKIGNLSGWTGGIMSGDIDESLYYYEPADGEKKIDITVTADYKTQAPDSGKAEENVPDKVEENVPEVKPEIEKNESEENKTEENKEPVTEEKAPETETVIPETVIPEAEKIKRPEGYDFGLKVSKASDKIKVSWQSPSDFRVKEYIIYVLDKEGSLVRKISGITEITRSLTVKDLAHDFAFIIAMDAVKYDGSVVRNVKSCGIKTERADGEPAKIFTVKYKASHGNIYGMQSEQVVFGQYPTKTPIVYAHEGYVFTGWSVDGKNTVDFSKLKIYSDTVLTAVFTKE